jgi:hypothetical protein
MSDRKRNVLWLVLLAAAGTDALTMGTRQTMGLFLSPLNTATGLGLTKPAGGHGARPAFRPGIDSGAAIGQAVAAWLSRLE